MNVGIQEDIDQIFDKGGAIEALVQARDQKMVRHLGVTGRFRPEALIECINRFAFDTVLMGVNAADKCYYSFEKDLLPLAVEKQMGIIGMKVMARGRILSSWTPPPVETRACMGRPRRNHHNSGHADQAGNLLLHAVVTHQYGNHRVRFRRAG